MASAGNSIESEAYIKVNAKIYNVIENDPTDMANELFAVKLISSTTWRGVLIGKGLTAEQKANIIHSEVEASLSEDGNLLDGLIGILERKKKKPIVTELNKTLAQMRSTAKKYRATSALKSVFEDHKEHGGRKLYPAPYRVRLMIVGTSKVGKTAIYNRYASDTYNEDEMTTFGIVTYKKRVTIIGKTVEVELVDTAGEDGFGLPTTQETHGALLVYDISNSSSFDKIKPMPDSLCQCLPPGAVLALVGNKSDLISMRQVLKSDAAKFAKKNNLTLFEVSAKTGKKVEEMFEECIKMVLQKIDAKNLYTIYNTETELPPLKKR